MTIAKHSVGKKKAIKKSVKEVEAILDRILKPVMEQTAAAYSPTLDLPIRKIHPIFKMKLFFRKVINAVKRRLG